VIAAVVGILSALAVQRGTPPDLSGEWKLTSATTNRTRDGRTGEQPTRTILAEGQAFNCGRQCRILNKNSTLTVENALLKTGATGPSPTVNIVIDGRPHMVVDSINLGNTIETVCHWKDGTLVITSTLFGRPVNQTISIEGNQLVVVKSFATSDTKVTLRYTRE
jgi:hypothetical protein